MFLQNNTENGDERKIEETKAFTPRHIEKFLESGETSEVKQDKKYDVFRFLMNEKLSFSYDKDPYKGIRNEIKQPEYFSSIILFSVKFTWYKDPNFRIDEEDDCSSDEERDKYKIQ